MQQKLKKLKKEDLQKIIIEMSEFLTKEQQIKFEMLIMELSEKTKSRGKNADAHRMSRIFVDEKMELIKGWMKQID